MNINRFKKKDDLPEDQQKAWLDWLNDDIALPTYDYSSTELGPPQTQTYVIPPTHQNLAPKMSRSEFQRGAAYVGRQPAFLPVAPKPTEPASVSSETQTEEVAQTISVNITVPSFKLPPKLITAVEAGKTKLPVVYQTGRRHATTTAKTMVKYRRSLTQIAAFGAVIVVGGVAASQLLLSNSDPTDTTKPVAIVNQSQAKASEVAPAGAKPNFKPVVPKTRLNLAQVTPGVSAYDSKRDSYSFTDEFNNRAILVSQQPVPSQFISDKDALTKISQQIGAKEAVFMNGNKAFMGTDSKSGQQTIVLIVNDILVFVQSPITNSALKWKAYLEDLQQIK